MILDKKPYTFDRVVRFGFLAGLIWGIVWLFAKLSDVLIPFAVALLLAYLMNPLVTRVQRKIRSRAAAVFTSLVVVATVVGLASLALVPVIVDQVGDMGRTLSDLVDDSAVAKEAAKRLPPDLWAAIKDYAGREEVQQFFRSENFAGIVQAVARRVLPGVWGIITGTASFLMGLIGLAVIALYLVFLLLDYETVRARWTELLPPAHREPVAMFARDFEAAMSRYFRGQAGVAFTSGIMYAVGFWIIKLPMGVPLGLLIGVLNMVPYLQIVGLIPAFLLATIQAVEQGTSLWAAWGLVAAVVAGAEIIQSAVLMPRILGKTTGLNPAVILLSLSVWGKLLGFLGLLLGIPLTCILFAYYRRFIAPEPDAGRPIPQPRKGDAPT